MTEFAVTRMRYDVPGDVIRMKGHRLNEWRRLETAPKTHRGKRRREVSAVVGSVRERLDFRLAGLKLWLKLAQGKYETDTNALLIDLKSHRFPSSWRDHTLLSPYWA